MIKNIIKLNLKSVIIIKMEEFIQNKCNLAPTQFFIYLVHFNLFSFL